MTKSADAGDRRHPISTGDVGDLANQPNQFDEALGREMAHDAQRVSDGELSESEFHEKYHEAVVEEFGRDDRPIDSGGNS